jgi:hypothetical protein
MPSRTKGSVSDHLAHYLRQLRTWWSYLRAKVWEGITALLEEFSPWLKWLVFDAVMSYIISLLAKRVPAVRNFFEAVGWL